MDFWTGKRVLVTGATGTVGAELIRQILDTSQIEEVVGIDNNESEVFHADQILTDEPRARFYVGDIRDRDTLVQACEHIDVVVHTAALKHVILCERSPRDAVETNIHGVQNVIAAATAQNVERVIFTSSDKAVNPTNVMGTSKLMGERLLTAANANRRNERPVFASTRFGNVLGSRGSVIPLFLRQIREGGPVTLTDPGMTRFIMTLREAVHLVLDSVSLAKGGEVFVTKMPVARIEDLAHAMIRILAPEFGHAPEDIEIRTIGAKPGEKLYEELVNEEEVRRTLELDRYFVVVPALRSDTHKVDYSYRDEVSDHVDRAYNSANEIALSPTELEDYLRRHELLQVDTDDGA